MFYLTPQERKAVIACVTVLIVGLCVQWLILKNIRPMSWVKSAHALHININTAQSYQLQMLPGVGKTLATKIMDYRRQHGPFTSIDDLRKVKGITSKRLTKMRELLEL